MMKWDIYTLRARLQPALLVALPVPLTLLAWFPNTFPGWGILKVALPFFGLFALLAQIGRDPGKKKELKLFESWRGKPTMQKLRHGSTDLEWLTLERYHAYLGKTVGMPAPSPEEEENEPNDAGTVYEAYVRYLREVTRDQAKYPLIFAENVNYGYRRNLWGMKPWGIVIAILGVLGSFGPIALAAFRYRRGAAFVVSPLPVVTLATSAILLLWWIFWINPEWVKVAADAYAERLLGACEALSKEAKAPTASVK